MIKKAGRPPIKDKKKPVTFLAKASEIKSATDKAKKEGKSLTEKMYILLYDYISI